LLVECDNSSDIATNATNQLPTGGLAGAMNLASRVFGNTALTADGKERGAGIYMYYLFDETQLNLRPWNFTQEGDIDTANKNCRDTAASRADSVKNLRTDFTHVLFIWSYLGGAPAIAASSATNADKVKNGTYVAVMRMRDYYDAGVQAGSFNANKYDEFFGVTIAHELTHMIGAKTGTPGFDAGGHTIDPNENNVVSVIGQGPVDTGDLPCLMIPVSGKENREVGSVRYFAVVKRALDVAHCDGLNP
jgi:hypothetical protein